MNWNLEPNNQNQDPLFFKNILPSPVKTTEAIRQEQKSAQSSVNFDWSVLADKPFWRPDPFEHKEEQIRTNDQCCFNHIIGLPEKNGTQHDMFDYEIKLMDLLEQHKRFCILKSRGLGITEFFLRWLAWKCVYSNQYKNADLSIIVGPREKLAYKLIGRMKRLFEPKLHIYFDSSVTSLNINNVNVEAFPSANPDSFRGLENPMAYYIDEADFYKTEADSAWETKVAVEGASAKSDPWVIFVSTPHMPRGFMDTFIQQCELKGQPTSPMDNRYYLLKLDYTYGLGKIYTQAEIDKAKQDSSFPGEYRLPVLGQRWKCV